MASSVTDNGGGQKLLTVEFPHMETVEELDAHIEQTYGPDVLKTLKDSNMDQAQMVEELHKYGLNGRSEAVERTYRLHQQEFARKETLLGKTWRWTTEAASTVGNVLWAPIKWTGQVMYDHPVLSAAALALLAWYGWGYLHEGAAILHGLAGEGAMGALEGASEAPAAGLPGMGPGLEVPGGGVIPQIPNFEEMLPSGGQPPMPPPASGPVA